MESSDILPRKNSSVNHKIDTRFVESRQDFKNSLEKAVKVGNGSLVKVLLALPEWSSIDSSCDKPNLLLVAAENGYLEIFQGLIDLDLGGMNPGMNINLAFRLAAKNGRSSSTGRTYAG